MARLFYHDSGEWHQTPLDRQTLRLSGAPAPVTVARGDATPHGPSPLLFRSDSGGAERWFILSPPPSPVRVNGRPLCSGLALLSHRDAIQLGAAPPLYFSAERLATVEPFPGGPDFIYCPRCKTIIAGGSPAVRCVSCELWFHQTPELPCYTLSACVCGAATTLGGVLTWSPEEL